MSAPARSEDWVLRFLRRGVVKRLNIALHDSKGALSCEWVNRDPDLKAVRDAPDTDWRVLMDRYCGSTVPKDPEWKLVHARASALAAEMRSVHGQPDRPWG